MSQRKATLSVEDLSSLPPRTLQAALKVSGEREAEKRKGGGSRRIKILEIRMLEAKLKQAKEELGDGSTDEGPESEYEDSEDVDERPAKRVRLSTSKASGMNASNKAKVMSRRDSCTWCKTHKLACAWDGVGTRCITCKKTKRGCNRRTENDWKPAEVGKAQGDLEKFAENLERRLGRMEKFVDKIGQEFFGPL